jgi:hypothetical protein
LPAESQFGATAGALGQKGRELGIEHVVHGHEVVALSQAAAAHAPQLLHVTAYSEKKAEMHT